MYKTTKTKTTTGEYRTYRKLYVYHNKPNQKWCYLKKEDLDNMPKKALDSLPKRTTQTTTQMTTQTYRNTQETREAQETLKSANMTLYTDAYGLRCPGSIVRSSISGCRPLDPGSNPGQGAFSILGLKHLYF